MRAIRLPPPTIPSRLPLLELGARRRVRLLALLAVRDEQRFLPGWLAATAPHVDGIVALDDGSADGSRDLLERHPAVLEVLRAPAGRTAWDEPGNHRALVAAGVRHGAGWLLSLDADERVERDFRHRAECVIRLGSVLGLDAYTVRIRDLWDAPDRYRADGAWGRRRVGRLFRARPDAHYDGRPLHASKAPLDARRLRGALPAADLEVYHLRMLRPVDRAARRARYERLDPEARWQPGLGYAYLTDERGLRLRPVPAGRGYL